MVGNYLNKRNCYSFFFFLLFYSILVSTNFNIHFPNDGVKYIFDSEKLISRYDLFYNKKVLFDLVFPFNQPIPREQFLNSNIPSIQVGIVGIIFFLRVILGDLWFIGYVVLISTINAVLFNEIFKLKKIFKISNTFFLLFLVLFYSNFEFIKTSKSFYNEGIYIPFLYIFIIRIIDRLNEDNFTLNFNFWLLIFFFLGIFFRIQHLTVIASIILLYFFLKYKRIKLKHYFFAISLCFFLILIYLYKIEEEHTLLNDMSIFFSFSNLNKIIDSSNFKFKYQFYLIVPILLAIFAYQLNFYLKEKNKIAIFFILYLSLNVIFLFALVINDERYYLTVYGILSLLLVDFFDKKIAYLKIKKLIKILLFLLPLFVLAQSINIYKYYKKTKTFLTIEMINQNLIQKYYLHEKEILLCEIDRICAWSYYINNLDTNQVYKFNTTNIKKLKKNEYLFLGSEDLIINLDYKIMSQNKNIVFAKLNIRN